MGWIYFLKIPRGILHVLGYLLREVLMQGSSSLTSGLGPLREQSGFHYEETQAQRGTLIQDHTAGRATVGWIFCCCYSGSFKIHRK